MFLCKWNTQIVDEKNNLRYFLVLWKIRLFEIQEVGNLHATYQVNTYSEFWLSKYFSVSILSHLCAWIWFEQIRFWIKILVDNNNKNRPNVFSHTVNALFVLYNPFFFCSCIKWWNIIMTVKFDKEKCTLLVKIKGFYFLTFNCFYFFRL